jgi:hypothetical protein
MSIFDTNVVFAAGCRACARSSVFRPPVVWVNEEEIAAEKRNMENQNVPFGIPVWHTCDVIENVRVLENDLRPAAVVAIERESGPDVVYPPHFTSPFLPG